MRSWKKGVLALLVAVAPALAGAQTSAKLAIGTIRGDASQVRRQILLQICGNYSCVAASRYLTDDKADPQKLAAGGVTGYLGGAVTGEGGQKRLFLTLTTPSTTAARPARTWKLPLAADGRLSARSLEQFAIELDEVLQGEATRKAPAPAAPPQRPPPATPPPAAKPPPPAAKPPPPPPTAAKPPPATKAAPAQASKAPRPEGAPLRFAAEAGLWYTTRHLSYSGASGGLRTFDANAIFSPIGRVELYPVAIAGSTSPLLAGIGVRLEYGHSVGLKVEPPAGSTEGSHDAALTTMRAGLLWRVQPMKGSTFTLVPSVGWRSLQLTTSAKDGIPIDFLPDANLSGFEGRLDLEAPVGPVTLLAGGGYTMWTDAKDLVSDEFFGSGSAKAFEVEGGAQFRLTKSLAIRGLVVYDSTSYSGLADPADPSFSASGATDKYFGARAVVRGEW